MRRLGIALLLFAFATAAQRGPLQPSSQAPAEPANNAGSELIVVPAGTTVPLAITQAVMAATAKPGESVFAQTAFPVTADGQMAIPSGTYVQGQIDTLKKPGIFSPHAEFQIHFTQIIFANGYTINLSSSQNLTDPADDIIPAVASVYVAVSDRNDVLLDNGAQIEMVLQQPLQLLASSVVAAVRVAKPLPLGPMNSASRCRFIPGTPGTPDTVIPGTPGTPGTPDTVIPGVDGAPDTVIPGTPATPGTPDTVIPGTPATPDIPCPGPPVVTVSTSTQKESFQLATPVQVAGTPLPSGTYEVTWKGSGPVAQVQILQGKKVIATVEARVVLLNRKSPAATPGTVTNSDGSISLQSLRFAGQAFALYFDQITPGETI
ncbi:MAG TPA: hypothetical protein VMD77_06445 [Candidatus Baltobacteraceae bacterium]|nr:hypothetical protein [Candidatus Baltobacteraceae bacterium]